MTAVQCYWEQSGKRSRVERWYGWSVPDVTRTGGGLAGNTLHRRIEVLKSNALDAPAGSRATARRSPLCRERESILKVWV
jgi:hypothetical protein